VIIVPFNRPPEAPYVLLPADKRRLLWEILDQELGSENSEMSCAVSRLIDSEKPCHNTRFIFEKHEKNTADI